MSVHRIPIYDLQADYAYFEDKIDAAIKLCLQKGRFIGGQPVTDFESSLSSYLGVKNVISCGNGTDALQLALMSLNLRRGSKIIVPAFTYIAPVEVIHLLGYEPVYADVNRNTCNINLEEIKKVFSRDIKAIIAVHLFGQMIDDIDDIASFCIDNDIALIEDNAQSLGAEKVFERTSVCTTSFFPTKNVGCYGDGGAVYTNDAEKAKQIRMMANHGQTKKYFHEIIGINSRLDTLQATILNTKLPSTDALVARKQNISLIYDECFKNIKEMQIPARVGKHTFHQYTVQVEEKLRDKLQHFLQQNDIESTVYYPLPAYKQNAYKQTIYLPNTERLCNSVLSLPVHPFLSETSISYICECVLTFFKNTRE